MNNSEKLDERFASDQILKISLDHLRKIVFSSDEPFQLTIDPGSIASLSSSGRDALVGTCQGNPGVALIFGTEKGWLFVRSEHVRRAFAADPAIENARELASQLLKLGFHVGHMVDSPFDEASFREM